MIGLSGIRWRPLLYAHCSGLAWSDADTFEKQKNEEMKALPFQQGDIVEFFVDFKCRQIGYRVNEKMFIITKIPASHFKYEYKYRFRVSLQTCYKSSVSIIDFCAE